VKSIMNRSSEKRYLSIQLTCSSRASSILSFHVETRVSISLRCSTSAMLARSAFCMKNYVSVIKMKNLAKAVNDHELGMIVCNCTPMHVDGFEKHRSTSKALFK
jgi:hypothetical protein